MNRLEHIGGEGILPQVDGIARKSGFGIVLTLAVCDSEASSVIDRLATDSSEYNSF
jgi:hypothetical protein